MKEYVGTILTKKMNSSAMIIGHKKIYHLEIEFGTVPIHFFIVDKESRHYLKSRGIKTLEAFIKTKEFYFAKKQVLKNLVMLKNKINIALDNWKPAEQVHKILKSIHEAQVRIGKKILTLLSTAKSLLTIFNRSDQNTILSSISKVFEKEAQKVAKKIKLKQLIC